LKVFKKREVKENHQLSRPGCLQPSHNLREVFRQFGRIKHFRLQFFDGASATLGDRVLIDAAVSKSLSVNWILCKSCELRITTTEQIKHRIAVGVCRNIRSGEIKMGVNP